MADVNICVAFQRVGWYLLRQNTGRAQGGLYDVVNSGHTFATKTLGLCWKKWQ